MPLEFNSTLASLECEYILDVLAYYDGNRTRAAKYLDISLRCLRIKLHAYSQSGFKVTPARAGIHKLDEPRKASDLGADEFIHKPPNREGLFARLWAAERSMRELIQLANTDALTALRNRRSFFETAEVIMARADLVSVVMLDIDHFKRVNDSFGHDVGDKVLRTVAAVARSTELTVGRLGGDEFAIILEGKDIFAAFQLADSLRVSISNLRLEQGPISVTCSFGVSQRLSQETIDDLLKRADVALYTAKTSGWNRVCIGHCDSSTERPPGSVIRNQPRCDSAPISNNLPQQVEQFEAVIKKH